MKMQKSSIGSAEVQNHLERLEKEIDCCLNNLVKSGVMTNEELECLLNPPFSSQSFHLSVCLGLVVDKILEAIKEDKLLRKNFDLWWALWGGKNGEKAGPEIWIDIAPYAPKGLKRKRGVLTRIVRLYRKRCKEKVSQLCFRAEESQSVEELWEVLREAITEKIILEDKTGHLSHNHAWADSKIFFLTYHEMLHILPRRKRWSEKWTDSC